MDSFVSTSLEARLEALLREKERQDSELASAARRLASLGRTEVSVPHEALARIAEACLVSLSPQTPALRG